MGWPGPTTHRQFKAWGAWLDMEMSRPSRADHYAMQTALVVNRVGAMFARNAASPTMDKFRLDFDSRHRPSRSLAYSSPEEASRVAVAVWVARVGGRVRGLPGGELRGPGGRPAALPAPLRGRGLRAVAAHEHLRLVDKRAEMLAASSPQESES